MASALYPLFKQALLSGDVDLLTDDVRVILLDLADYTYDPADEFLDDVAGTVGTATALASKTIDTPAPGVFDAADTTMTAVSGDPIEAVLLYVHTGASSTSRLVAYMDGVSLTPNGGDIVVQWPADSNRIFAL